MENGERDAAEFSGHKKRNNSVRKTQAPTRYGQHVMRGASIIPKLKHEAT